MLNTCMNRCVRVYTLFFKDDQSERYKYLLLQQNINTGKAYLEKKV